MLTKTCKLFIFRMRKKILGLLSHFVHLSYFIELKNAPVSSFELQSNLKFKLFKK